MNDLLYITSSKNKAKHMERLLGKPIEPTSLSIPEIQSVDLKEVILGKTKNAYELIQKPLIIDDVSFTIKGMGKLPGPFFKFFYQELGNETICRMVDLFETREAVADTIIGYHDGRDIHLFDGSVEGIISEHPSKNRGFGWDEIFIPTGFTQIRSDMTDEDYDKTSPRVIALEKLKAFLSKNH